MSGAFVIGTRLVSPEELDERVALGEVERFRAETARGKQAAIRLFSGTVTSDELATEAKRPDFAPIGIGKPLTIEILTTYTGDAPKRFLGFLTGDSSLLITSGARGAQTTKAAPRAINNLVKSIKDNEYLEPSAFNDGSPVVYHVPAVVDRTTLTSYDLVVDSFDDKLFDSFSSLFAGAGGLPIFAPASAYLLAGSVVMKIFSKLGKALLESDAFLSATFNIQLASPGIEVTQPRHLVLYNASDEHQFEGYEARPVKRPAGQEQMRLVERSNGQEYQGPAPYIIASLDGAVRNDLKDFTPMHASAGLLEDFYKAESGAKTVEVLGQALELYNDMRFRDKAERLSSQLSGLPEGSKERAEAEKLLKAYKDNIRNEILKLK